MKRILTTIILALFSTASLLRAATPTDSAAKEFESHLDLAPLRIMSVMDQQTVKTFDSFARQTLERICGTSSYDGQDPVFTILDIANHPDIYQTANLIKIRNVPLRAIFRTLSSISDVEKNRIIKEGTVSLEFLNQADVKSLLQKTQGEDTRKGEAIGQMLQAYQLLQALCQSVVMGNELFYPPLIIPPAVGSSDLSWHTLGEVAWSVPEEVAAAKAEHDKIPAPLPGYTAEQIKPALIANEELRYAWRRRDAAAVNADLVQLTSTIAKINPAVYPSELTRHVEVIYNRLAKMTLPGAVVYFFAFVCFLISSIVGVKSLRLWGLRLLVIGFAIHTAGIGVRWWLEGTWLPPIKNEFESVMFSAWFGVLIGMMHELGIFTVLRRLIWVSKSEAGATVRSGPAGYGILGAAASFVGMLSLLAIFAVPYVFHISIGENVGQVNGVLMSYWLYVHVMMVTASYSMIGMAFLLGSWWLIKYYSNYQTLSRVSGRQLEGSGHGFEPVFPTGSGSGGGTGALSLSSTLAQLVFFPVAQPATASKSRSAETVIPQNAATFLATLDACNLVVLQLAFWTLGVGIVLGAIWADQSWGRFWAWDPKETFALVTWIAYLIIVHVRVATQDKAWWTSVLSIVGFFLMLFNWIGVNYFLPGLHSYAG
jgi:cytochrome c-type biogenesis protein CcsB